MGDLNTQIERLQDRSEEELATIISAHGLEDQAQEFLPWSHYQRNKGWTWDMWM